MAKPIVVIVVRDGEVESFSRATDDVKIVTVNFDEIELAEQAQDLLDEIDETNLYGHQIEKVVQELKGRRDDLADDEEGDEEEYDEDDLEDAEDFLDEDEEDEEFDDEDDDDIEDEVALDPTVGDTDSVSPRTGGILR
jgi:hypothetical protein